METIYKTEVMRLFGIEVAKIIYSYTPNENGCSFSVKLKTEKPGEEITLASGFHSHPIDRAVELLEKFSQNLKITVQ